MARWHLTGSNEEWKEEVGYAMRSLAETTMSQMKMMYAQRLSLRDYDAQVSEAMARVKAMNIMTLLGMPISVRIA